MVLMQCHKDPHLGYAFDVMLAIGRLADLVTCFRTTIFAVNYSLRQTNQ